LLRGAGAHLGDLVPGGLHIAGSGGKGTATLTPWVGVFDPDETTRPEDGLYVVYLWAADLASVTLTLLQGITRLDRALGHREARRRLAEEAAAIRAALPAAALAGLDTSVDLGASGFRQLGYSAACVVARRYEIGTLPPETTLRQDLARFLAVYQDAIEAKRRLAITALVTTTEATVSQLEGARDDLLAHFRPKDDSDYVARLQGRKLIKSRRHERLIAEYGRWAASQGFAASTSEHPRDLVLRRNGAEWLVEAKVLYRGNATEAVRAALGQLFTYRHFLWEPPTASPYLVALFSEPIGDAYVSFLDDLGVAVVWKETEGWRGSATALTAGVAA
jgi:hypothetical protein